jgi:small subunit ribosomal protein S4
MARYTGPNCRICRRAGEKLFLKGARCYTPKCEIDKRNKPPGQAGGKGGRRRRFSDRAIQLREKQKARFTYGVLERQFRKTFEEAERLPGITSDTLLVLLERRLDNVVYRLGFADSRKQARQLVRHGHIVVNGKKTNIPSYLISEGDSVSWREGSKKSEYFKTLTAGIEAKTVLNWLNLDRQNLVGQVISLPTPDQIDTRFDGKAVIEYYSR